MRRIFLSAACAAGIMLIAMPVQAQGKLLISLSGAGEVPVKAATSVGLIDIGRVDEKLAAEITEQMFQNVLNAGKGERWDLVTQRLGSTESLILVGPGTTGGGCQSAELRRAWEAFQAANAAAAQQEADEEHCEALGVYTVGTDLEFVLTLGAGGLQLSSANSADVGYRGFTAGLGGRYNFFNNASNVACGLDGLTDCTVEDAGIGLQASLEYRFSPKVGIGLRGFTGSYSVTQGFADSEQTVDVSLRGIDLFGHIRPFDFGPIDPYLGGGWGWWHNSGEFSSGGSRLGSKTESGGRLFLEGGLDLGIRNSPWGGRLGMGWGSFDKKDADKNRYFFAQITYNY